MNDYKPLKKHLDYLDRELGVFMHYGIRTFNETHRDWDMKPMSAASFDPSEQDCRSWIRELKDAGVKYTVLTSKHHDGFALWQSNETEYCMKNAAYKNGKGDVVKEYVDACREYGMFCGIYYSCAQFDTEEKNGAEYDDFVVNQLTELLTNYGKIDLLWFDGCGSEKHEFDNERITKTIRTLQPDIFVFGSWGRDARWIGNEWGAAPLNNPNTENFYGLFLPAECDCCITRNQSENFWFYNETHKTCVRTPEEMLGLYYHTIGRGSNLLPNVRVIIHDKSSLAPEGKSIAFCLDPEKGFEWIGEYDITADELLSGAGGNNETKTEQAARLILDLLADGKEMLSEDIVKAAAEAGISERTVRAAKRSMGDALGSRRVGSQWYHFLKNPKRQS